MPSLQSKEDTIAAVATPPGQGGIGIIRISGSLSKQIIDKVFRPKNPPKKIKSHRLYLGHLIDPSSNNIIDEVLLSFMKAPNSYTREDVVEINSHSGYFLLSRILEIILKQGARLAQPGEFTFRAFLNERIDLTQAEAVIDIINSKSEKGITLATHQIKGVFKEEIERLRQRILSILAQIEVAVDFPEEEEALFPYDSVINQIETDLVKPIKKIISMNEQRKIWIDGVNTVISGRVNVGKSSLLNRLLNEERAIVTPIPGTTRDIIESTLYINGIPLKLMDTAGFRDDPGEVEKIGVKFAKEKLNEADLVLMIIDQSRPISDIDMMIVNCVDLEKSIIILNKTDLKPEVSMNDFNNLDGKPPVVEISALKGDGIDKLRSIIHDKVIGDDGMNVTNISPNLRHQKALEDACVFIQQALSNLKCSLPLDIIAVDLNGVLESLSEIIGITAHEELLDKIFSQFCLGK